MREPDLQFLTSPEGRDHLARLTAEDVAPDALLATATALREVAGAEGAQALIETVLLRERAAEKFSRAADMLFTRDALEQASGETIARYRAARFAGHGFRLIGDLGCGIGGDSIVLAEVAAVVGVERDPVRLRLARHNLAAYDVADRFLPVVADLQEIAPLALDAFFIDPARRTKSDARSAPSRRLKSLHAYQPPWPVVSRWLAAVPNAAMKAAPGLDYEEVPPDAGLEFVSVQGEVKEGILWFGDLRSGAARMATLLPAGVNLSTPGTEPEIAAQPPQRYLYEPDGAVIRAHLVRTLAAELDATLIDPTIAYLTGDHLRPTPFARAFELEATFPFQLKRLRHYLREHHIGRVVIKKRGSPLDPDDLRRALRLSGDVERTVFLTQVLGRPFVLIGRPAGDA
jgi:SAM-dependent methyltransferase